MRARIECILLSSSSRGFGGGDRGAHRWDLPPLWAGGELHAAKYDNSLCAALLSRKEHTQRESTSYGGAAGSGLSSSHFGKVTAGDGRKEGRRGKGGERVTDFTTVHTVQLAISLKFGTLVSHLEKKKD